MASIVITDKETNKEYELGFNRYSLLKMEEKGFNLKDYEERPLKSITLLIKGAFIKNHSKVDDNEIEEVISRIDNFEEFVSELANLYADALNNIVGKGNSTKKATWGKK